MKKTIKNTAVCGIDLGTGFSEIAILDDNGRPTVIPNLDGEFKTPSVVYVAPKLKEIIVGTAALSMGVIHPDRVIRQCKRDVGSDKVYFTENDIPITPEWVQAEILKYLRASVIKYSGDDRAGSKAVITVPAFFNEKQRQSVQRSADIAGIEVMALINEPTAAGLAHGLIEKQGDRMVLICDFGQGTFDCSVVSFGSGKANVIASHGDNQLGGKDVDDILLKIVLNRFTSEHGLTITPDSHPADYFQIWQQVVQQKERLSACSSVKICARVDGKQIVVEMTREILAKEIASLITRAEKVIDEAIANGKVDPKEITNVLGIGGSSRLTAFQDMLKRKFGPDRIHGGNVSPDLAIAEGAAIHVAKLVYSSGDTMVDKSLKAIPAPTIQHTDVMPHSLGVSVQDPVSKAESCSTILEKNQPLPCSTTKQFGSVTDDQRIFVISVLQGEDGQPVKDCLVVGQRQLELPPRPPGQPSLEVTMGYDSSGMANVVFKDLLSDKQETITVNFYAK